MTTRLLLLIFTAAFSLQADVGNIADVDFNADWLFQKGEIQGAETVDFNASSWMKVSLPHDHAIEGPFSDKHNARTGGLPVTGEVWYRKNFDIPAEYKGKIISVEFDGAMSNSHVWINGKWVGERPYGYIGFEFDLTEYINFGGENVIAVRLNTEDLAMRWYPGGGLYRNVRLKINNPLHIPQWGTFVSTPSVTKDEAFVDVLTTIQNHGQPANGFLRTVLKSPSGKVVGSDELKFDVEAGSKDLNQGFYLKKPNRWDLDNPVLYTAVSEIVVNGEVVDSYHTEFGIRSIDITSNDGFLINGKRVQLNGVCMHHDLGPLGAAVNYRATERQMQIMQSMGVNSLRTSHNPPSPEMLQVCDRLGIVVIVEAFDEWQIGKVENGYHKHFDKWHERDLRDMIKRDRNHPSVIMWSIGNEILEQAKKDGWKLTKHLNDICHNEDPTRKTTVGFNYYPAPFENKLAHYVDVVGMNYWPLSYSEIKERYPDMVIYGSETSSQTSTRGKYAIPWDTEPQYNPNYASSYDVIVGPPWAYAPDAEFEVQEANPFVLGEYIWTGFDYLGEPTPYSGRDNHTKGYWNDDWPSRSSYFAPVDLCGFAKDRFYLYQSQWTDIPMVHVLPHWNWEGMEGEIIPVVAYTNAEEVELFVNGKSYGKKVKGVDKTTFIADYYMHGRKPFESPYRLSWDVPYEAGDIEVVAFRDGKKVATKKVVTAGIPAQIELIADRRKINADGKDLSFITIRVLDEKGNFCPNAENLIHFNISGAGELAAVGNGDQTSLASFRIPERKAFSGKCMLIVKSTGKSGKILIEATSDELKPASLSLKSK